MSENDAVKKPVYKKWWFWALALCIIGYVGSQNGDPKNSNDASSKSTTSSSSSSSSTKSSTGQRTCSWCSSKFAKGTGYRRVMGVIANPEFDYSCYCSRGCATKAKIAQESR